MRIRLEAPRDIFLLLAGWAITLAAALGAWASHSQTIGQAGRVLGGTVWARALLGFHAASVLVLLAFPLVAMSALLVPALRSRFRRRASSVRRLPVLLALMAGIGLAQPLAFLDIGRLQFTLGFLVIAATVLVILVLFLGPEPMPASVSTTTIAWLILIAITRLTLQALVPVVKNNPGLDWATGWSVAFSVTMAALIACPFLAALPRIRPFMSSAFRWAARIPFLAVAIILVISAATGIVVRTSDPMPTSLWAFQRFMALVTVVLGCLALVRVQAFDRPDTPFTPRDLRTWIFSAVLTIIALAYTVEAVRIGLNGLYYLNPDGVAYMIIARYLARGMVAIRGYWSPLMPALLAPFIRLGADPQVGQRILSGTAGLAWIGLILILGRRVGLKRPWLLALAATMAILTLEVAFFPVTPDILGAVVLTCYFILVTGDKFLDHPWASGIVGGVMGALLFYAKFYNLPFFLAHVFLTGLLLVGFGRSWSKAAIVVMLAWCTSAILVAPWILALHSRYGVITLTTSGPINHAIYGPSMTGHPCWDQRLCNSPRDTLIPWEDPQLSDYADVGWNPLGSWENLRHQILLAQGNVQDFSTGVAFELGPFPPVAVFLSLFAVVALPLDKRTRFCLVWSLMTILLYVSGYMTFLTTVRYMVPITPIAVLGGYQVIQLVFDRLSAGDRPALKGWGQFLLAMAVCLSILNPETAGLKSLPPDDHCVARTTAQFADALIAPIAGSDKWVNIIAYYSEKRTLGVLPATTSAADAESQFYRFGVRTYIVGEGLSLGRDLLARGDYTLVAETNLCGNRYLVLRTPVQ